MRDNWQNYDIRRKSDGLVVHGSVFVASPEQAVGYYVARVLKRRYEQNKFYATPTPKKALIHKPEVIAGACPTCGYPDPQRDQASHCPNCECAGST